MREKKDVGCLGSGWSGKACVATKRVWMLTKKTEILKNILLVIYKPCLKFQVYQTTFKPILQPQQSIRLQAHIYMVL